MLSKRERACRLPRAGDRVRRVVDVGSRCVLGPMLGTVVRVTTHGRADASIRILWDNGCLATSGERSVKVVDPT